MKELKERKGLQSEKPFGFCHKWIIFKTNQLMSRLYTEKIKISKCSRQSNTLFWQFFSKVTLILVRYVVLSLAHTVGLPPIGNDIIPIDV